VENTERELPTPARVIALIRAAETPLGTSEIAELLGLHPNGVRVQLKRLEQAGVVEHEDVRGLVGRPRARWHLTPRAIASADLADTGWLMARALARTILPTPERLRDVENAGADMGREIAAHLVPFPGRDVRHVVGDALEALGFDPERTGEGDSASYRLTTCPYADIVRENPTVVCTLHRGVVRGVLDSLAPSAELTVFEPKDPDTAGCIVGVALNKESATRD
jgi:predicted ArsR family transcriptional regulator